MIKKTYKDFKIGQPVICISNTTDLDDWYVERINIGEIYIIKDLDFHFPDKICIKFTGPYYFHSEFTPIEFFMDISEYRNDKINKILDNDESI